jgi:hypothetical protein
MKMVTKPNVDPGTTEVPFKPRPAPSTEPVPHTDTSPQIAILKSANESREIDNLRLSVTFMINGQQHFDYEDHGTFNQVCVDRVYAYGGKWNGSRWVGDFLHTEGSQSTGAFLQTLKQALEQVSVQTGGNEDDWAQTQLVNGPIYPQITIVNEEPRAITGMRVQADFTINGQPYTDYEDIGPFDRIYYLELTGMNGTLKDGKWVGNFLSTTNSGFNTTIPAGLLTFLNILVIICTAGNAVAAAAGAATQIKHGGDGDSAAGAGFKLSQVW